MTQKVNGAAYPGVWFEKKVAFVKLTFNKDISALAATDLNVLGTTTTTGAGTVADSTFGVVESAIVQALKIVETKATILGVSKYDATGFTVDVILGNAQGWFSDNTGLIAQNLPIVGAQAVVTTEGADPSAAVGALVAVKPAAVNVDVHFAALDGTLPVATEANGDLSTGPGATSGASPVNSATGTAGFYPGLV